MNTVPIQNWKAYVALVLAALCVVGAGLWPEEASVVFPKATVHVDHIPVHVEIAQNPRAHEQGLQHRTEIPNGTGMLFVYPAPRMLRFWMHQTPIDLDIGFFDVQATLINIRQMSALDDRTFHHSDAPAQYALEVPRGWFADNAITPGAKLTLPANPPSIN